jgi:hypothetical protein
VKYRDMKRNTKALGKVIGPNVTVDGSENMFRYHEQKSGMCNNIKMVNNFLKMWQNLSIWKKPTKSKGREKN